VVFLRHYVFELFLNPNNGSSQFAADATFCPQPGNSGTGYTLQSSNHPTKFIRHYNFTETSQATTAPIPGTLLRCGLRTLLGLRRFLELRRQGIIAPGAATVV
jgi:hypothetical protein